ncbi:MAG: 30S ribosomal protein S2, partial [Parasphingorhabdus sp.]|uniref:30S ribosomal protein S2 n=3 Tax=Parasphingorhabdus sp. TaxID=2709688 RepID=UPI003298EB1D
MKPYIFGARNSVHILDLSQSVPLFARALDFIANAVSAGGKVLFVGTKRQAQEPIAEAARASGQHFVNHRWLGGMLTNWKTISNSIRRMKTLEEQLGGDTAGFTKKEVLQMTREHIKLELSLGGIRDMGGIPDVMFVIDANKEELAIKEANVLGIPVVAILDSNVDPSNIAFPVPGNDDAARAIRLYCESVAAAATKGGQDASVAAGEDLGAAVAPPVEQIVSSEANASAMASGEEAAVADIAEIAAEMTPAEEAPAAAEPKAETAAVEAPVEEAKAEKKAAPKKAAAKKPAAKKAAAKKDDDKADAKA